MPIIYRDVQIGTRGGDFLVEENIPVEIKTINQLDDTHLAQRLNYQEACKLEFRDYRD